MKINISLHIHTEEMSLFLVACIGNEVKV